MLFHVFVCLLLLFNTTFLCVALYWNSVRQLGWPRIQISTCLCHPSAGIQAVSGHYQIFLCLFAWYRRDTPGPPCHFIQNTLSFLVGNSIFTLARGLLNAFHSGRRVCPALLGSSKNPRYSQHSSEHVFISNKSLY